MNTSMIVKCCEVLKHEGYAEYITSMAGVIMVIYNEKHLYPETVDPFYTGEDTHKECQARRQLDALEKHYRVQTHQNGKGCVSVSAMAGPAMSEGYNTHRGRCAVIEMCLHADVAAANVQPKYEG